MERAGYTIEHRDVITMMSTVSGGVAYRQQMIPMFAEELRDSANNGDIYEIFLKTHEKLRNKLKVQLVRVRFLNTDQLLLRKCHSGIYLPTLNLVVMYFPDFHTSI